MHQTFSGSFGGGQILTINGHGFETNMNDDMDKTIIKICDTVTKVCEVCEVTDSPNAPTATQIHCITPANPGM